jgi:hypothetical protein
MSIGECEGCDREAGMNYHQARQRQSDGKWAWTTMNDGRIWTSGGCVTWPDGEPTMEQAISGKGIKSGTPHAHDTKEEAERCFYDYEAARLRETGAPKDQAHDLHRCEFPGCAEWTSQGLTGHLLGDADLCDAHRNAEGWRVVHPFSPGISITASW